ncbi:ABC transporter substrate-binding protein [Methanobrevibacter sp. AbM4]|uniref:ABC transporter substrate-binding protein n=1 Tax=Methanobrevibacter sp. AbM4 TaxID=224719 RepID=UPI000334877B|nr:ABC transporter substrate-binding protein [Methanobrevibacter sp. AbM4]AGN17097.1 bicarbonate ABC transporter substrate-binding protein BtcC [Methanobrevibacter sp. AbM4]
MDKKTGVIIAIVIIIIAIIGGYYAFGHSDETTVKIGYLPSDHDSALFVAQAQKQYEAQGINVETSSFNNGGDLMTAMASGDIDVGYVGVTPALSSISKGIPVKIVSGAQMEGSGILVSNKSSINSIADLKGKKVATPGEASIQYMLLEYALNKENVNISQVNPSSMKVAQMNDALKTGSLDAIVTYEPYASIAVSSGYGKLLENSSEIMPDHPCCVVVASDSFIKDHPKELKSILAIHENATKYIKEHPDEAAKLLPSDIVPNASLEGNVLKGIDFVSGLNDTYKQSVMDFKDTEIQLGVLNKNLTEDQIFYKG